MADEQEELWAALKRLHARVLMLEAWRDAQRSAYPNAYEGIDPSALVAALTKSRSGEEFFVDASNDPVDPNAALDPYDSSGLRRDLERIVTDIEKGP